MAVNERERLNWWVAVPVTLVGVGAVLAALSMEKWGHQIISSTLLEFGAALGLVVVLVMIEPRVTRRFTEAAAQVAAKAAQEETADLRKRVVNLEELGDAQRERRAQRRADAADEIDAVLSGPLSAQRTGQLLSDAISDAMLNEGRFHVRAGRSGASPILFVLPVTVEASITGLWFDIESFEAVYEGEYDGAPWEYGRTANTVEWSGDRPADEVAAEIEAVLERSNEPVDDFHFDVALRNLGDSVRTMRAARAASTGSAERLDGKLELLINPSWVITTSGLESVKSNLVFPITRSGFHLFGGGVFGKGFVEVGPEPAGEEWQEARTWINEREGWDIRTGVEVGEDPLTAEVLAAAKEVLRSESEGTSSGQPDASANDHQGSSRLGHPPEPEG